MLQLPQIQSPSAKPATDAKPDPAGRSEGGGEFGRFLDSVTEGSLTPQARDELVQQVQDGVPVSEVLASLLERVQADSELTLAPGMMPVIQAMAPQLPVPAALVARLTPGRPGEGAQAQPAAARAEAGAADLDPATELPAELPESDALLGKHKALLAGRVAAVDQAVAATPANSGSQTAALKVLELPVGMASLVAAADDTDGPISRPLSIAPRVGEPQWGQALAQRIVWMVGNDKQSAELRLNPAHLGPLEVKLTLQHDQASLSMIASNGAVRDALEQALPRLRDMLGQQDLQLAQVDVGQRQDRPDGRTEGGADGGAGRGFAGTADDGARDAQDGAEPLRRTVSRGLVDAYA